MKSGSLPILTIDENGIALIDESPVTNDEIGQEILYRLVLNKKCFFTTSIQKDSYLVLPFDEPIVARSIQIDQHALQIYAEGPYSTRFLINLESLCLDEWDRIHGLAQACQVDLSVNFPENQLPSLPFVMSRKAQAQLFDFADRVSDDSIYIWNREFSTPAYFSTFSQSGPLAQNSFWNNIYLADENPGWNLRIPAPAFFEMTPRLKLPKSRILVLGCGEGHDAAFFAREGGHIVTAVDFSPESIRKAKSQYGHLKNMTLIESDIFKLPDHMFQSFDIVVEHTCYCAIPPEQRSQLSSLWKKLLSPQGMLMGVFFTMEKRQGPPFGATEWEIRERLRKDFRFLFWKRWENSVENRQNLETYVLAQRVVR